MGDATVDFGWDYHPLWVCGSPRWAAWELAQEAARALTPMRARVRSLVAHRTRKRILRFDYSKLCWCKLSDFDVIWYILSQPSLRQPSKLSGSPNPRTRVQLNTATFIIANARTLLMHNEPNQRTPEHRRTLFTGFQTGSGQTLFIVYRSDINRIHFAILIYLYTTWQSCHSLLPATKVPSHTRAPAICSWLFRWVRTCACVLVCVRAQALGFTCVYTANVFQLRWPPVPPGAPPEPTFRQSAHLRHIWRIGVWGGGGGASLCGRGREFAHERFNKFVIFFRPIFRSRDGPPGPMGGPGVATWPRSQVSRASTYYYYYYHYYLHIIVITCIHLSLYMYMYVYIYIYMLLYCYILYFCYGASSRERVLKYMFTVAVRIRSLLVA